MILRFTAIQSVVLSCLLAGACKSPQAPGELAFAGSSGSMEELAREALSGLAASDAELLNRLRLTEAEHNEVVWPELPASAPEIGFPVDLVWRNIELRSSAALDRIGGWFRSNAVRYQVTECRGATQEFATFQVHTDCWVLFLTIRGELLEAQLFKDVLERDGGFKIFRYYDELPRRAHPGRAAALSSIDSGAAPSGCLARVRSRPPGGLA